MGTQVRTARREDIPACTRVLANAFKDDPLMSTIWPEENLRKVALPKYFDASLRYHHIHGGGIQVAEDTAGEIAGVAVWDPPGAWQQPLWRTVQAAPALVNALQLRIVTAMSIRRTLERNHPDRPQWYLVNIGTDETVRGLGHGAAMMNARIAECDERKLPAYLVSTRSENVPYYESFGFQVTGEFRLHGDGPTMWSMWRDSP